MHPLINEALAAEHRRDLLCRPEVARQRRQANLGSEAGQLSRRATQRINRRLGVGLIRLGGRLVARRRPTPAPCPWCDLAFPSPDHDQSPGDREAILVGAGPAQPR